MTFQSINPVSGTPVSSYDEMQRAEVSKIVDSAHAAFLSWRTAPFRERAALMKRAGQILRDKSKEYGRLMAEEMGKPLKEGIAEAEKCAGCCDFFADHAEKFLASEMIATDARKSYVAFQPLGVVLAVMPWNFPFRGARFDGGQRRRFKARLERAGLRARARADFQGCGLSQKSFPHADDRQQGSECRDRASKSARGDVDRQRPGRTRRRGESRRNAEENRSRARRQRRLHYLG
jgi:hypothetical protein